MTALEFCAKCQQHHEIGRCPLDVGLEDLIVPDAGHIEVSAFDAYETAKPNEPTFTLQGGDEPAPNFVLLYAKFLRFRAGVLTPEMLVEDFRDAGVQLRGIETAEDEVDRDTFLLKAVSAEEVAWAMQAYQRDWPAHDVFAGRTSGEYRQDVFDARKDLSDWCSKADSELAERVEKLQTFEEHDPERTPITAQELQWRAALNLIAQARQQLQTAHTMLRPRRAGEPAT